MKENIHDDGFLSASGFGLIRPTGGGRHVTATVTPITTTTPPAQTAPQGFTIGQHGGGITIGGGSSSATPDPAALPLVNVGGLLTHNLHPANQAGIIQLGNYVAGVNAGLIPPVAVVSPYSMGGLDTSYGGGSGGGGGSMGGGDSGSSDQQAAPAPVQAQVEEPILEDGNYGFDLNADDLHVGQPKSEDDDSDDSSESDAPADDSDTTSLDTKEAFGADGSVTGASEKKGFMESLNITHTDVAIVASVVITAILIKAILK